MIGYTNVFLCIKHRCLVQNVYFVQIILLVYTVSWYCFDLWDRSDQGYFVFYLTRDQKYFDLRSSSIFSCHLPYLIFDRSANHQHWCHFRCYLRPRLSHQYGLNGFLNVHLNFMLHLMRLVVHLSRTSDNKLNLGHHKETHIRHHASLSSWRISS